MPVPSSLTAALRPADPIARALTTSTAAASAANGVFYSVSALFFTGVAGLPATTVGLGLTIAGAVGVLAALLAGRLCDAVGAHRVLAVATAGQGLALLAYALVRDPVAFTLVACAAVGCRAVQGTARSAVLAGAFPGPERVAVRARLHVVVNVSIGLGTCVAALALLVGTAAAYSAALVGTGLLTLLACAPLRTLAGRVAAPPRRGGSGVGADAGRSPLRDGRYLALTALNAVVGLHFGLQTVGVPLWIAARTDAPAVTVSLLMVLNTVLVASLQVRASRGTHHVPTAARAVALSGALLALACALYAASAAGGALVAVALLVLAALVHALAEVRGEAGAWGLSFELADPRRPGAYQGVSQTGYSLSAAAAPLLVTATAVDHGAAGWAVLAVLFAGAGAAVPLVVRSARPAGPAGPAPAVVAAG
ncbi:MFS transporter [Paenibacillus sp. TRM 82003]|uniref:MFS transporter n=1 Tax=Kineococcus sp. TRM81007 TaxID=2925831 RepID=UPI001F5667DC|nr:MFS transporter [Kineococcus sp. TRM81007]MCI2236985.1 MFS transporter [Kineococcus sp. TRM81007]MCI3926620.1 MFS transporter [Paenibacillus sp. TRM 82003]